MPDRAGSSREPSSRLQLLFCIQRQLDHSLEQLIALSRLSVTVINASAVAVSSRCVTEVQFLSGMIPKLLNASALPMRIIGVSKPPVRALAAPALPRTGATKQGRLWTYVRDDRASGKRGCVFSPPLKKPPPPQKRMPSPRRWTTVDWVLGGKMLMRLRLRTRDRLLPVGAQPQRLSMGHQWNQDQ